MPDRRHHRGAHPEDARLFCPQAVAALRAAVADLSWLLGRNYATPSAVKLVGDRYNLTERQRVAVMRAACSDRAAAARLARRVPTERLAGRRLLIDGYNLLTTVEAALSGGVILACRDSCYRDMASVHGTWRKVDETPAALALIGEALAEAGADDCVWLLDSPVSNSGRLKSLIEQLAAARRWNWRVELPLNPDAVLKTGAEIAVTADSAVLDECGQWTDLARHVVGTRVAGAWVIDLTCPAGDEPEASAT